MRMPLPDRIKNAPVLFKGLEFYYRAYWRLSTCRQNSMSVGSITYMMCVDYCNINDIIGEHADDFIEIILQMDSAHRKHLQDKPADKPKKTGE